jgi:hypothetical protein
MQTSLNSFIIEETQEEPVQRGDEPSEVYKRAEEATREKFYEWFGTRDNTCCEHGKALDESGKQEVEGTVQGGKKADVSVSEDPCTEIAMQRYGVRSGEACCRYGKVNTRLHLGALILYKDGSGSFKALADIDHLYHECVKGLIDNIRAFKTIFDHFSSKGMNIYAVSKCFDDCIHVSILGDKSYSKYYTIDNGPPEIRGLKVDIGTFVGSIAEAVKNLERHISYMQAVNPDVLQRGLNVGEGGAVQGVDVVLTLTE